MCILRSMGYMVYFVVLLALLHDFTNGIDYLHQIEHYEHITPLHIGKHARNRRDVSTKTLNQNYHLEETKFQILGLNKIFNVSITKNRILLPESYSCIIHTGAETHYEAPKVEHCYYHGTIDGQPDSNVVLTTCNGLSGMIEEESGDSYYIEPHPSDKGTHVLFNMKHLQRVKERSCGVNHTDDSGHIHFQPQENLKAMKESLRVRRATTQRSKKYIETIAVMDYTMFQKYGTVSRTEQRAIEVMNYVDAVYKTMNTRVALTKVIVWNTMNMISITTNAGMMLGEFREYTSTVLNDKMKLYPDNAQLLTNSDFDGTLVGLAGIGVICSLSSCAVNYDHTSNAAVSANTVAHEMGHNLGFYHNTDSCSCVNAPCVMGATAPYSQVKGFTSCTIEKYEKEEDSGSYPCLYDYPDTLVGPKACGNGYLEEGETCDCGTEEDCKRSGADKCCDFKTCKLHSTAQCADGTCCENCKFKSQGSLCRQKMHSECDLEEFCLGTSAECPRNSYVQDGGSCSNDEGICHQGLCKTHDAQCEALWGTTAMKAEDICFSGNEDGDRFGHCGTDARKQKIKCAEENILCGKIQCQGKPGESLPRFPLIGTKRVVKDKTYYIGSRKIDCRVVTMDFPAELADPTLAAEGTKCRENAICMDSKCKNVSAVANVRTCKQKCQNGGVCNNMGNCHCPAGWACPYCEQAGPGGSVDSGQGCLLQDDCECLTPLVKGMLVLFLLILPLACLIGYLSYRHREQLRNRWRVYRESKRGQSSSGKTRTKFIAGNTTTGGNPRVQAGSPYVTHASANPDVRYSPVRKAPAAKPTYKAPPPPSTSGKMAPPPYPPSVGSSSPRPTASPRPTPGKLPQISAYNKMDADVKKPYR
ncbi:zinc metalloproteinase-disintegrin-like VLAIP-B [Clytia hemisphaerica]|uniref:Uncharacterized protein n=1 Tax=Clytia hemisphaerica TaxID=252671 RepID=A0A7M5XE80_9CNID